MPRGAKSLVVVVLVLSSCATAFCSAAAEWINAANCSPVFRPEEALLVAKNGTVSTPDRPTRVETG